MSWKSAELQSSFFKCRRPGLLTRGSVVLERSQYINGSDFMCLMNKLLSKPCFSHLLVLGNTKVKNEICYLDSTPHANFLLAWGANKAAWVVGLAQRGHNLPFDEVLAAEAASSIQPLVVQSTDVFTLPHKESSLGQLTATYWKKREEQIVRGYSQEKRNM